MVAHFEYLNNFAIPEVALLKMKELMKANGYVDSLTAELGVNGVLTPLTEVNVILTFRAFDVSSSKIKHSLIGGQ